MTEQQIDPNHPWVEASMAGAPQPIPATIRLEPVELEQEGKQADAIMMSIIDPTGVKNVFMPPQILEAVVNQAVAILQGMAAKQQSGLIVADKSMEQQARQIADQQRNLRSV